MSEDQCPERGEQTSSFKYFFSDSLSHIRNGKKRERAGVTPADGPEMIWAPAGSEVGAERARNVKVKVVILRIWRRFAPHG